MANEVKINVTANTAAAKSSLDQFKGGLNSVVQGLTGFNVAQLASVGTFIAVAKGVKDAVDQYRSYAEAMRGLAAITGTGTEETSRMVQAFDDLGVSQDKVTQIMTVAARSGFVATTESIAKLADQYVALGTQEEKNALLTKELGRGGLELAKVFEQGGQAFRDAAKAQADGMLITEQNAAEAEKLRVAQDNLDDSVMALKNSLAKALVPALTELINSSMHAQVTMENLDTELAKIPPQQRAGAIATAEYREAMESNRQSAENMTNSYSLMAKALQTEVAPSTNNVATGFAALTPQMQAYILNADAAAAASQALSDKLNKELTVAMQTYNTQLQYQIASEGLSAEKKLSLANAMGLIDEKSRYAIVKTQEWREELNKGEITIVEYQRMVAQLANDLQRIQSREVWIVTHHIDTVEADALRPEQRWGGAVDLNGPGGANGLDMIVPPGYPNDSFPVRAQSGERVTITPANQVTNNSSSGLTINVSPHYYKGDEPTLIQELSMLTSMAAA